MGVRSARILLGPLALRTAFVASCSFHTYTELPEDMRPTAPWRTVRHAAVRDRDNTVNTQGVVARIAAWRTEPCRGVPVPSSTTTASGCPRRRGGVLPLRSQRLDASEPGGTHHGRVIASIFRAGDILEIGLQAALRNVAFTERRAESI